MTSGGQTLNVRAEQKGYASSSSRSVSPLLMYSQTCHVAAPQVLLSESLMLPTGLPISTSILRHFWSRRATTYFLARPCNDCRHHVTPAKQLVLRSLYSLSDASFSPRSSHGTVFESR